MQAASQPSADYDAALKRRLAQRVGRLLKLSTVAAWLLLTVLTTHPALLFGGEGWLGLITQTFIVKPAWTLIAAFGIVAVVLLRKRNLRNNFPSAATTRISNLTLLLDARSHFTMATFLTSAFFIFIVWWHLATISAPEPNLQIFIPLKLASNPQATGLVQFNPRFAYLCLSSSIFAILYAGRFLIRREATIKFGFEVDQQSFLKRTTAKLQDRFVNRSLPLLLTHNFGLPVVWLLVRRPLLRLLVYHTPFRHYFAAIYRHSAISSTLILRSASVTLLMAAIWDLVNVLFDVYCTQAAPLSQFAASPNSALVQGLNMQDDTRKHLAYLELAIIAKHDSARRRAIFKDISGPVSAFQSICDVALQHLQQSRTLIANNGQLPQPQSKSPTPTAQLKNKIPLIPVKSENIVRPARPAFLDRFAASKSDPPANTQSSGRSTQTQISSPSATGQQTPSKVPSVFLSQSPAQLTSNATSATVVDSQQTTSQPTIPIVTTAKVQAYIDSNIHKILPEKLKASKHYRWLYQQLPETRISKSCATPAVDLWAIEALADLLCHSLKDDPYGVVQKDLPRIMETFLAYSNTLEAFVKQIGSDDVGKEALSQQLQPLLTGVQGNIAAVLQAFKPFLGELKIQPALLDRLRPFIEWSQ